MQTEIEYGSMTVGNVNLNPRDMEFLCHSVHEANRAWCIRLGDESQPTWDKAPDWQRNSCLQGVIFQLNRMREPSNPAASHESWSLCKINDGWTYGEVKDPEKKTHPCLVPFDELPPEQQFKDAIFETIVRALFIEYSHKTKYPE